MSEPSQRQPQRLHGHINPPLRDKAATSSSQGLSQEQPQDQALSSPTRREALKLMSAGAGLLLGARLGLCGAQRASAQGAERPDPIFMITVACSGGASLLDGPLTRRASEVSDPTLNAFPDSDVWSPEGSELRAARFQINDLGGIPYRGLMDQRPFLERHHQQLAALTYTGTSVNHLIAQKRSLTGNDAWYGRTLQEAHAAYYGEGYALPSVTMASGGYLEPGHDPSLPLYARSTLVSQPLLFSFGLDGSRGLLQGAQPSRASLLAARQLREALEGASPLAKTFASDPRLTRWREQRAQMEGLEGRDLINKLNFLPNSAAVPLDAFGLSGTEEGALLRETFPRYLEDPLEAQAALAYLLITQGASVNVTIGPDFSPVLGDSAQRVVSSTPLAFDFSHNDHRGTQALMWGRVYSVIDRLISLLSAKEWRDGVSYWDRSLVHVATEFGRTRRRPEGASAFATGHDLNNGLLVISPLIRGGRVYGGVDSANLMGYGFDLQTGAPTPQRETSEAEAFSAVAHALNLEVSGVSLPTVTALRRG